MSDQNFDRSRAMSSHDFVCVLYSEYGEAVGWLCRHCGLNVQIAPIEQHVEEWRNPESQCLRAPSLAVQRAAGTSKTSRDAEVSDSEKIEP